jgi:hypothetical protein
MQIDIRSACAALTSAPAELATMGDEVAVSGQAHLAASGQFLKAGQKAVSCPGTGASARIDRDQGQDPQA